MSYKPTLFPSLNNSLRGTLFMVVMTACFSMLDASAKYMGSEFSLWMVLWGRYVFHFLFISIFFLPSAPRDIIFTRNLKLQLLRSTLIFCAGVCFWAGLMYLPLVDSMVIFFTSPLWVTGLAVFLLGEKVDVHRWGCVIVGLLGVIFVIRPGAGIFHWAVMLPLCSALFYAVALITTRVLGQKDKVLSTLFYSSISGLVFSSVIVVFLWETPSPGQWVFLMWLGFIAATGHYFMVKAFENAPASLLAPFDYISLLWAVLLGFLFFGDLPDAWTLFGAVIVISSGIYLVRRETRAAVF